MIVNPTASSRAYYANKKLVNGKPVNDGKPFDGNNKLWLERFNARMEGLAVQSSLAIASANLVGAENDKNGRFMGLCFPGGTSVVGPIKDTVDIASYFDYFGTDPAKAVDEQIIYATVNLANAKRLAFTNFVDNDFQKGNVFSPELYAQWYKKLTPKYVPMTVK